MTYLTQQVRLLDTAPQLLNLFLFERVFFTDSDDTLRSGGLPRTPLPGRYVQHSCISGRKTGKNELSGFD